MPMTLDEMMRRTAEEILRQQPSTQRGTISIGGEAAQVSFVNLTAPDGYVIQVLVTSPLLPHEAETNASCMQD
jgi:hypothetical protein